MAVTTNPLDLARNIGHQLMGNVGAQAFEELELAFASRLQPRFKDVPEIRPWQNICFYWARSYLKNTLMEHFQEVLPVAFPSRFVTAASTETMFGSISDDHKKLIPPLFYKQAMVFIPEIQAFLGEGETFRDRMNKLNDAVEGKRTSNDLLKFGNADALLIDQYKDGIDGLFFDGQTLWYHPKACFVIGTRPLHPKPFSTLEGSGFWSRFHVIQFTFTDSVAQDIFTGAMAPTGIGSPIYSLKQELKKFNTEFMQGGYGNFSENLPEYESLMLPILQEANIIGKKHGEKYGLDMAGITSNRVRGDIYREVNAYRILTNASSEEVGRWIFPRLEHFFSFIVNPQLDVTFEQKKLRAFRKDDCENSILNTFKGQKDVERDLIKNEMQKLNFSIPTLDRALKTLVESGKIAKAERGKYVIP